ncbi:hypothetical protein CQW23_29097 [Capsicum baccatum]|uniref:Uncharacterized protein n=1 Tax=Capsicum baccatum TaxID=33114 RepID=A0A2G2VIF8_CAPBA|nr:hypothetical protein CQW23_29097 [Capsicum baccatum]
MNEELALQEATATGLKIIEHLIKLLANGPAVQVDCRKITDFAVAKLKEANSMVGQTSHARFYLGPVQAQAVQAQNEVKSQAQAKVQVHDSLTSLSLSLYGYMEKERVLTPAPLSVVTPVAASVQTTLMLGFWKSSVNVVAIAGSSGGSSVGDMKWKDAFGKQPSAIGKRCREQEQSTDGSSKKRFKKVVMFTKMNDKLAFQEAASTGSKTIEHLIKLLASEPVVQVDYREIIDFVVAKLKKANSMVGQTGHSRFRRGPVQAQAKVQVHDSLTSLSLSP